MAGIECCWRLVPGLSRQPDGPAPAAPAPGLALSQREEIELKCYSLTDQCLLLEADRRCRLISAPGAARCRPIRRLEEGRSVLDVRRPDSMSLICYRIDLASGQVSEQLAADEMERRELEQLHCDFHELSASLNERQPEPHLSQPLAASLIKQQIVDRMSARSFLLLERADDEHQSADQHQEPPGEPAGEPPPQPATHGQPAPSDAHIDILIGPHDAADQPPDEGPFGRKLRDEFLASIVVRPRPAEPEPAASQPKPRRLNLIGRLNRLLTSSGQPEPGPGLATDDEPHEQVDWSDLRQSWHVVHPPGPARWPSPEPRPSLPVMISYNHNEAQEYAVALRAELGQLGVSAYLDLFEIRKGADWQDSLNEAILNCRLFVPLVTPSYGETLWTSRECKLADVLSKRIVPINFGLAWPPASLAIQFATLQFISWLAADAEPAHRWRAHEQAGPESGAASSDGPGSAGECWPRGRDSPPPHWPRHCVRGAARQLRRCLRAELGPEASCASAGPQPPVATNCLCSGSLIDSGYDSPTGALLPPPQQLAAARSRETDAILAESAASRGPGSGYGSGYGSTGCTPPASPPAAAREAPRSPAFFGAKTRSQPQTPIRGRSPGTQPGSPSGPEPKSRRAAPQSGRRKSLSISRLGRGLVKRLRRSLGTPTPPHQPDQLPAEWRRWQPRV